MANLWCPTDHARWWQEIKQNGEKIKEGGTPTYLGGDEVGGVTRGHEQAVLRSQLLGEAKVADPDGLGVPALVHIQDVTGLQVSVHHLQTQQGDRVTEVDYSSFFSLHLERMSADRSYYTNLTKPTEDMDRKSFTTSKD